MKKLLLLPLMLVLTACAAFSPTASTQQVQVQYVQACAAYGVAFNTALQLRQAGKLNQTQIDRITALDNQITPICTGSLPTNPQAAVTQIMAAVTTLSIIEATKP